MIESDFDWMDVGTWSAILELNAKCEIKPAQHSLREDNSNRLLSKLACERQVLGAHGAENRSVLNIHEDLSTEATTQFPTEVEFRKKSNELSSVKSTYTQQNRPLAKPVCDEEFLGGVKMSTTEYSNVFEERRRASTTKLPSEIGLCKRSNVPSKSLMSFINKIKKETVVKKEIKPWGFYSIILIGKNFLIKYLFINPLSCTSKQFHNYRDEYHIILSGAGYVSVGNKVHSITQSHMIEIPRNVSHRIENRSENSPLEIVEFQIGEHLSDDDIVRLDDVYGRI
ncbi:hypothetical protein ASM33_08385 [Wolbachia endosymbiont of Folsomia candida]|nr:hypothetical protein ASM33_08385 [Wolbachia endosymbiont of Folsomia candida]